MKQRAPAFQFFPRQFSGDDQVMGMDLEAVGAHMLLMCTAASSPERCRIDADEYAIRTRLRNPSDDAWQRIKKQLLAGAWKVSDDGKYWIQRGLERTFQKQKEFSDSQRARADQRWSSKDAKSMPGPCGADAERMPEVCSSSSSSASKTNIMSEPSGSDPIGARPKKTSPAPTDAGLRMAQMLKGYILQNNPNAKLAEGQIQKWAVEADRMVRNDGRTERQIADLIAFSQQDSFWFANILSMSKLRQQFDQLTNQRKRKQQDFPEPEFEDAVDEPHARPKWVGLTDDRAKSGGAK
jgi:hypothetical protein